MLGNNTGKLSYMEFLKIYFYNYMNLLKFLKLWGGKFSGGNRAGEYGKCFY